MARIPKYMRVGYTAAKKRELKEKYRRQTEKARAVAKRRYAEKYPERVAKKEQARQRTAKAREYAKIAREHKKALRLREQGFKPSALENFVSIYEQEYSKPAGKRNLERVKSAYNYYISDDTVSGFDAESFEDMREVLDNEGDDYWRVYEYLRDMGLGSWEAIDAQSRYASDTGGKPVRVTLEEYANAIYQYLKSGRDVYEDAVKQSPWKAENLKDIDDMWEW